MWHQSLSRDALRRDVTILRHPGRQFVLVENGIINALFFLLSTCRSINMIHELLLALSGYPGTIFTWNKRTGLQVKLKNEAIIVICHDASDLRLTS